MSIDLKLSKGQIYKMIQSGGLLRNLLGSSRKKVKSDLAIPYTRVNFSWLISNLASNAINKFERKISGQRVITAGKGFNFFFEWRYEWYYQNHKIIRRFKCINLWY